MCHLYASPLWSHGLSWELYYLHIILKIMNVKSDDLMIIITTHIYLGLMSLFTEGKALEANEVHSRKGGGKWIHTTRFYVVDKCRIFTRQYVTFFCLCNNFRDQSKALKTPWHKTNAYGQVTFVYVCLYVTRQLDESLGILEMTLLIAY